MKTLLEILDLAGTENIINDIMDKRKNNGGARPGTGPKPKLPGERKVQVQFSIKEKYVDSLKPRLQKIVDKANSK